jgi:hypothetical protein
MWRDAQRESRRFDSAVLTTITATGPTSVRCHPVAEPALRRLAIPDPGDSVPGKASLLYHRHDERLWKLRSCLVMGTLENKDDGWQFAPERFVPGLGVGGVSSYIRFLRKGRKTAAAYLAHRGLERPQVRWDEITELLAEAASDDRNVSGTAAS